MISSKDNPKIKELIKLHQAKYRKETNTFLVEGKHLVKEAFEANAVIEAYSIDEIPGYTLVSLPVMKKICKTDTVVTEVALCKINEIKPLSDNILILDNIQDPGNLGTILRTAKAFKFDTVIISKGSCDLYNDKVIRSSQGAIFKLNILNNIDLLSFIPTLNDYEIYGTNVRNGTDIKDIKKEKKIAIILGNEGNGISKEISNIIDKNIYIKLDNMESLNVSIAGAIIMYEYINK